jgi:hypothetical protein
MFGKNRKKKVGICVMVVTACLVLAGLWAVLAAPETALGGKPGGKKQEISVSVTFRDGENDRVYSDEGGAYTRERGNKVKAFIGMGGQLRLNTWDSTVRSILLNIPASNCPDAPDPEGDGWSSGHPSLSTRDIDLLAMTVGSSTNAGLRITFPFPDDKNGDAWRLIFGDVDPENFVTVTRLSQDVWTIEAGVGDAAVAGLIPPSKPGGGGPTPACAFVKMPFKITVEILP